MGRRTDKTLSDRRYAFDVHELRSYGDATTREAIDDAIDLQLRVATACYNKAVGHGKKMFTDLWQWCHDNSEEFRNVSAEKKVKEKVRKELLRVVAAQNSSARSRGTATEGQEAELKRLRKEIKSLQTKLDAAKLSIDGFKAESKRLQDGVLLKETGGGAYLAFFPDDGGTVDVAGHGVQSVKGTLNAYTRNELRDAFKKALDTRAPATKDGSAWNTLAIVPGRGTRFMDFFGKQTGNPPVIIRSVAVPTAPKGSGVTGGPTPMTETSEAADMYAIIRERGNKKRAARVTAKFKFGVNKYLELTFIMHRPLPEDATITKILLVRKTTPAGYSYQIQFSLCKHGWFGDDDRARDGACGVDLNWTRMRDDEGGLRVLTWKGDPHADVCIVEGLRPCAADTHPGYVTYDTETGVGHVRFTEHSIQKYRAERELRSAQDDAFNKARDEFAQAISDYHPAWVRDLLAVDHVMLWKNKKRLLAVLDRLEREPEFSGRAEMVGRLVEWRDRNRSLGLEIYRSRVHWFRWRDWFYKNLAAMLARAYGVVYVENLDLKRMERKPEADEESNEAIKRNKAMANHSFLQAALKLRVRDCVKVESEGTSLECSACGEPNDVGGSRRYECVRCGFAADRDENAACNILKRGEAGRTVEWKKKDQRKAIRQAKPSR